MVILISNFSLVNPNQQKKLPFPKQNNTEQNEVQNKMQRDAWKSRRKKNMNTSSRKVLKVLNSPERSRKVRTRELKTLPKCCHYGLVWFVLVCINWCLSQCLYLSLCVYLSFSLSSLEAGDIRGHLVKLVKSVIQFFFSLILCGWSTAVKQSIFIHAYIYQVS